MIGQKIAHYHITAKLGEGGMGEVYRATDTKLSRDVAIKVLPAELSDDPASLERFKREARVLASLNHSHIATIHGLEESGDIRALVLELVEGDTLAERLRHGPMPLNEALLVFKQIAEALEVAHQQGVIHRDLKPANIKFTSSGQIKVLDFGLAKAMEGLCGSLNSTIVPADGEAPTARAFTTQSGMIVGTPTYMSPEQSRAQEVDKQTDVWSFGCCLYEALAGKKPFRGETLSDILAEILKTDPDYSQVPLETPTEVVSLLRRCLEKEPSRRLRDMGDIAIRLEESIETSRRLSSSQVMRPEVEPAAKEEARGHALWQNTYVWMILACLAIAIGYKLGGVGRSPEQSASEPGPVATEASRIDSIAVLPFDNLGNDDELNYLSKTMVDAIRDKLIKLKEIAIRRGRGTVDEYLDDVAPGKVDALVHGNFVQVDGMLQISASLTYVKDERELALGMFTNANNNILEIQSQVALAIAERIHSNLTEEERREIAEAQDIDPDAYIAFREGLAQLDAFTVEGFTGAIESFERAIELDETYLAPWIKMAHAHWLPMIWGTELGTAQEGFSRANEVLARARVAFPEEAAISLTQAYFDMLSEFDWKGAKAAYDTELARSPNNPDAHIMGCWYLLFVEGRYREALRAIDQALALDPDRLLYKDARAEVFAFMDNEEEALRLNNEIRDLQPAGFDWLCNIALNLKNLDRISEALELAEEAVEVSGRNPSALAIYAEIRAALGEAAKAREILEELKAQEAAGVFVPAVWVARVYAELEDPDKAVELLVHAYEHKEGNSFLYNLRKTDFIRMLADHPGYWALVDKMNYPQFPIDHPFHEKERQMRNFGKSPTQ